MASAVSSATALVRNLKMYVFLLMIDDQEEYEDNPYVEGVYSTLEKAQAARRDDIADKLEREPELKVHSNIYNDIVYLNDDFNNPMYAYDIKKIEVQ